MGLKKKVVPSKYLVNVRRMISDNQNNYNKRLGNVVHFKKLT
jgi:hypothetical protein